MKYVIMLSLTQKDLDMMAGWSPQDAAALRGFMAKWNNDLVVSGEFVEAYDLTAPVHARRITLKDGVPVITDGPYAETQEVLGGYTIVDCVSYDRATEIAAQLTSTPHPPYARFVHDLHVDIRPIAENMAESLE